MRALWRDFVGTLVPADVSTIALYVGLSLLAALAGSLVAVSLVPLVQPGHAVRLAGYALALPAGLAMQVALFAGVSLVFAALRWHGARLAARLTSRYAIGLRQRVHAALIDAPLPALSGASSAEIANVLTYNIEIATQGFSAALQLLVAGMTALVSICIAVMIAPALLMATPLLLALAWLGLRISSSDTHARISRDYVADMTQLFWLSEDFPRRLRHVRSFQREALEARHYERISARLGQGYAQQQALVAGSRLMLEATAVAAIAGILVLANLWQGADRAALITVSLLLGVCCRIWSAPARACSNCARRGRHCSCGGAMWRWARHVRRRRPHRHNRCRQPCISNTSAWRRRCPGSLSIRCCCCPAN